jgi:D-tyrosyl-tRNA(Tyr) deacylase
VRLVIQRVSQASVNVDGACVGAIQAGVLVLLGVHAQDTPDQTSWLVNKLIHLRIFPNEAKKMDRSLLDIQGEVLIVSQFTLYGNCTAGRRPEFTQAAPPQIAEMIYEKFVDEVRKQDLKVETGVFGADMKVSLVNDGPVTLILDAPSEKRSLVV